MRELSYDFNKRNNRNGKGVDLFWLPLGMERQVRRLRSNIEKKSPIPVRLTRVDVLRSLEPVLSKMADDVSLINANAHTRIMPIKRKHRRGIRIEYEIW